MKRSIDLILKNRKEYQRWYNHRVKMGYYVTHEKETPKGYDLPVNIKAICTETNETFNLIWTS